MDDPRVLVRLLVRGTLAVTLAVVMEVKVKGQMVVEIGITEVTTEGEPDRGQLVTDEGQLNTVISLVLKTVEIEAAGHWSMMTTFVVITEGSLTLHFR